MPSAFTRIHSRTIYNGLDLLGDVGGLYDGLKLIAAPLISLLTQGGLYQRLVSLLFFLPSRFKGPGPKKRSLPDHHPDNNFGKVCEAYSFAKALKPALFTGF